MSRSSHSYPDGATYTGEWKGQMRHGKGVWRRPDGMVYEGEWKDDKPDGRGSLTYPDGRVQQGQWKAGKFVGEIREPSGANLAPAGRSTPAREAVYANNKEASNVEEKHYNLIGFLLAFIGGFYGMDRYYRGQVAFGILKMLTFGGFFIWWLIDVIVWAGKLGEAYRPSSERGY